MNQSFDIIIVGGSIAGLPLAISLGRNGFSVCVVEKASFPRRTPCGEGLSVAGADALRALLSVDLFQKEHTKLAGYQIIGKRNLLIGNTHTDPRVIGIQRTVLDATLLEEIGKIPQITLLESNFVTSVNESAAGASVTLRGGGTIHAKFVVLANGRNQVLLANSKSGKSKSGVGASSEGRYGLSAHFRISPSKSFNHMCVLVKPQLELYCTPVGSDLVNVNLLTSKDKLSALSKGTQLDYLVSELFDRLHLDATQTSSFIGAGPFGSRATSPRGGRILAIGDALESLDPIGGMGMTHAILSARRASQLITNSLHGASQSKVAAELASLAHLRTMTNGAKFLVRDVGTSLCLSHLVHPWFVSVIEKRMQIGLRQLFTKTSWSSL
jgi:flavin-dependent dehydrogenase